MKTSILNVTLGRRLSALEEGSLVFEQEPWSPNMGYLTKVAAVALVGRILGFTSDPAPFCGDDGEGYSKKIYAYPCPSDLRYDINISSGTIGGRVVELKEFSEEMRINYNLTNQLRFCVSSLISYEWIGDTFDLKGQAVSKPTVTIDSGVVTVSKKIYGVLRIKYEVYRHVYEARVRPIITADENSLVCYIYAVWDGGNGYLEVDPPPGAEEKVCNNRRDFGTGIPLDGIDGSEFGDTTIREPNGTPRCVRPQDETVEEDYCSGLPL